MLPTEYGSPTIYPIRWIKQHPYRIVPWMGKTKAPLTALPAAAVVLLALVSCGVPPATTPANETTTPTAACPSAGTEPRHANCFAYDGDAAMAQNEMYRQRRKLSPDVQSQLEQHIEPAKTALSALQTR